MTTITTSPQVTSFYDSDTFTFSYIVHNGIGSAAAIIDPVLDYDPASAVICYRSINQLLDFIHEYKLNVQYILETHAHADHLSGGDYLRHKLGAQLVIGKGIIDVQKHFKTLFNLEEEFIPDGRQFDQLLTEEDSLTLGDFEIKILSTPGHTDDSVTYLIGDAAFIGDTVFAADTGTARADFPGGDAKKLYQSIQKIFSLPPNTRLFLCHDYPPNGREVNPESSISAQLENNPHVNKNITETAFIQMRETRDKNLAVPRLILPSIQVNIRAGKLPPADNNGVSYLKLPLNKLVKSS